MGEFQVADDLEILLTDADDLLPDGTAILCLVSLYSCAIAAFFSWVQRSRWVDILVPRVVMGA